MAGMTEQPKTGRLVFLAGSETVRAIHLRAFASWVIRVEAKEDRNRFIAYLPSELYHRCPIVEL